MPRGPYLTEVERRAIWERRRQGESFSRIARHIGRSSTGVQHYINSTGGIRPRERRRSKRELSLLEREEILQGLAVGQSCRAIARALGRAASSVSREVKRNGGRQHYRATRAELAALVRRQRPKLSKLALHPRLRCEVEAGLRLDWSPQQIAARLKLEYPGRPEMQISHETIYLSLYVQGRGTLRKELTAHLRSQRMRRRPQTAKNNRRRELPDEIKISARPAEAADRAVPGHWEGDLLLGRPTDAVGTLVERSTRYLMLFALAEGRISAEAVREGIARSIQKLPRSLRRSLTWDRGAEMAEHLRFTIDTGVQIYFCDPYSPWQRGTNENTNGLLRQYFPKGRSLKAVTQEQLDAVAEQLNGRPRQTLGWRNPAEKLAELLEQTASAGGATTA